MAKGATGGRALSNETGLSSLENAKTVVLVTVFSVVLGRKTGITCIGAGAVSFLALIIRSIFFNTPDMSSKPEVRQRGKTAGKVKPGTRPFSTRTGRPCR
jgi:hypothetical protein